MTTRTRSVLLAAVLATPLVLLATPAQAQYRVNNGGALDANNRIGSGGTNDARPTNTINGNDIVTGNVTGGREFRGNVGYTSQGAFHGNVAGGSSDRLVRQGSGAYSSNANTVKPFIGTQYAAPAPSGFVENKINPGTYTPAMESMRGSSDVRLGQIDNSSLLQLPRPGELMLPGQVDAGNSQSLLTASALYGIRTEDAASTSDDTSFVNRYTNFNRNNLQRRLGDDKSIQNMRDELNKNLISDDPNDASANPPADPGNFSAQAKIDKPFESPVTTDLNSKRMGSSISGTALEGKIASDQSTRNQLVPAPVQSEQYAELTKRFQKLNGGPQTDQQAAEKFQKDRVARKAAQDNAAKTGKPVPGMPARPGTGTPGNMIPAAGGGATEVPGEIKSTKPEMPEKPIDTKVDDSKLPEPVKNTVPETPKTNTDPAGPTLNTGTSMVKPGQPLVVKSLTDGMKAGGLRDTLATAEDQMRQGKYTSALDQYDLAERVAPNNPLITLGRAHAELGASYYARAETSIRRALNADNALLLAQFNLSNFLGKERVDFLEKDLKDITTTETKSARAPFLLAYLKYNTGDSKMAATYLALSEKRAGKEDPLYKQLRTYWNLPAADALPDEAPAEQLNK